MKTAYLFCGLPGSGKSAAADIGEALTGGDTIHAGKMIRRMAEREGIENPSSHELADFAADKRSEYGGGFFGEKAVGMLEEDAVQPDYPVFVDSVRHISGARALSEYFDSAELICISARPGVRLERIQSRARDDEEQFTIKDLMHRDKTELEQLGQETVINDRAVDHTIVNEGSLESLRSELQGILL